MSDNSNNPYASPSFESAPPAAPSSTEEPLANRGTRFVGALIDGILISAIILPVFFSSGYMERAMKQQVGTLELLAMSLMGVLVMLAFNGYLLYKRGQTIGKFLQDQKQNSQSESVFPYKAHESGMTSTILKMPARNGRHFLFA